jgi:hypothetical protein
MKKLMHVAVASSLAFAAACTAPETSTEISALAAENVDTGPECEGILTYVNGASYAELDSYLPAQVATDLVARRAVTPFVSMADISSISGIAQARLVQIAGRALTLAFIDTDCAGVYEEHAVTATERTAILAFVNNATEYSLENATPNNIDVVPYLLANRPYTTLQALANTPQVGIATFHALKVAAIDGPFEVLADAVNAAGIEADIRTDFYWYDALVTETYSAYRLTGMLCFGIDPDIVDMMGGQMRSELADADEVVEQTTGAIEYADRFNGLAMDQTAGLADLAAWADGRTFYGCYIDFMPNPWMEIQRRIYVDTATNTGVVVDTWWSE